MKQLASVLLVGIVASMILFGCKGGDGPQGPAGAALTGNLHGKVIAYDSFGNYLGFMSGVMVTVDGTSFAGTTDSLGAFTIAGLPMGTYSLSFSKVGYGTQKWQQIQFVGRGDFYLTSNTVISGLPNFEPATAAASIAAGTLHVTGTVNGGSPPYARQVVAYVGKTSAINPTVPSSYVRTANDFISSSSNSYDVALNVATLMSNYGFVSGNTIYVAVYSSSYYNFTYYDYPSGTDIHTSLGTVVRPANVLIP